MQRWTKVTSVFSTGEVEIYSEEPLGKNMRENLEKESKMDIKGIMHISRDEVQ